MKDIWLDLRWDLPKSDSDWLLITDWLLSSSPGNPFDNFFFLLLLNMKIQSEGHLL